MLSYEEIKNNKEVGKLIQYGYDLHKRGMDDISNIPTFKFSNYYFCKIKEVNGGGIFGIRNYPDHSSHEVFTILGVSVGTKKDGDFTLEYAHMFETDNKSFRVYFSNLKRKNKYALEYDHENDWDDMPDEEKVNSFIKAMEFVGFRKEDIIGVLTKTLTVREAYMNVAPVEIKNMQWVNINRRDFEFDGNVAVMGNFGSMYMDRFPFPFEEQPILDCSKVKTCWIHFKDNHRKVKLINVNENRDSIKYTNLKNAVIDEAIDLCKVDATGTKFGHHTVINLEYSIAKIEDIDLTLAVNEDGERYVVNEKGVVQFDYYLYPKTISNNKKQVSDIKIFANADSTEMVKNALNNDTDGIGLVRTEHIFNNLEDVKKMVELLKYPSDEDEIKYLNRFKELQIKQVKDILSNSFDKPVVFRLLDFKLKEYLMAFGLTLDYYDDKYINYLRGAHILEDKENILKTQLEAIFEVFNGLDIDVNLLVPLIRSTYEFISIKNEIIKLSEKYNLKSLKIGAMIENIEMSNEADILAKEADFISIGTNDLTESVTGLSRSTNSIEFQELTDEVKSVIKETIYRARAIKSDIVIGICGEHSNYIENIDFLNSVEANYITCSPEFIKTNKEFLKNKKELETSKIKRLSKID